MAAGRSAKIADTRLSGTPAASIARTDTGTSVRIVRSVDSSRERRRSRNPAVMAVSTTSLTVPPKASRISLTSVNRARAQSQRRCGPIGPLSAVASGGRTMPAYAARPWTVCAACAAEPGRSRTERTAARASRSGQRARSARAAATSWAPGGVGAGCHGTGSDTGASRLVSMRAVITFDPAMPSTMAWCSLEMIAQRPPARPSTTQVSHSGRLRSSWWDITRPTRIRSCSSPPGAGRAVRRTW